MELIVCVKRVPDTSEAEIKIGQSGKEIVTDNLAFNMNEADNYALEEALLIKEKMGGTVTLITAGPEAAEDILRMGLAKGADTAIRIDDPLFAGSDGPAVARILAEAVKTLPYDLILTGCMASDNWDSVVGPAMAELLSIPHAALVTNAEIQESTCRVQRELEGGLLAQMEIALPALLTIQTGINEPRYASIMGIAKASKREITIHDAAALGLGADTVGDKGSGTHVLSLSLPVQEKMAEILTGSPDEVSASLAVILKERGLV